MSKYIYKCAYCGTEHKERPQLCVCKSNAFLQKKKILNEITNKQVEGMIKGSNT